MKYWKDFIKYKQAFDYIAEYKPKLIVEYGGGDSTYYIYKCLEELNYGGKVIGYEDDIEYYTDFNEKFTDLKGILKLVEIEWVDREKGKLRYKHKIEDLKDVEMVIIDGPNYQKHLDSSNYPSNITTNLEDLNQHFGKNIPFFIDGRKGCIRYYCDKLKYSNYIKQIKDK